MLHTTDLHGHFLPAYDYEGHDEVGGLLRCATLIEKIKAREKNVLLVDCGDLIQGGAESYNTQGRVMIKALEWLGYDAWVLENHEFDWGLDKLAKLHDLTTLNMLGANIKTSSRKQHPLNKNKPYIMKDIDGVRVALVGLTTPGIPS
ncbi:MAG: hypothetical protein GKR87_05500 [Kiritimatiellae bacterium]|nr:hypothetical protein [Kiritimatiellia bacterium]